MIAIIQSEDQRMVGVSQTHTKREAISDWLRFCDFAEDPDAVRLMQDYFEFYRVDPNRITEFAQMDVELLDEIRPLLTRL